MKLCQYIISVTIPYPAGSIQLYSVWVIKALIKAVGIDIFLQPKSSIFFKVVCKILKLPCDFLVDYKIQQYRVFYNINLFCKISESHKNTQFFKGKSTNLRNSHICFIFSWGSSKFGDVEYFVYSPFSFITTCRRRWMPCTKLLQYSGVISPIQICLWHFADVWHLWVIYPLP